MTNADSGEYGFGCPICAIQFKANDHKIICTIPCGHVYHENCLKHWFHVQSREFRHSTCPKCRASADESQILRLFLHETIPSSTSDSDTETVSLDDSNRSELNEDDLNLNESLESSTPVVPTTLSELNLPEINRHQQVLYEVDYEADRIYNELITMHITMDNLVHSLETYDDMNNLANIMYQNY